MQKYAMDKMKYKENKKSPEDTEEEAEKKDITEQQLIESKEDTAIKEVIANTEDASVKENHVIAKKASSEQRKDTIKDSEAAAQNKATEQSKEGSAKEESPELKGEALDQQKETPGKEKDPVQKTEAPPKNENSEQKNKSQKEKMEAPLKEKAVPAKTEATNQKKKDQETEKEAPAKEEPTAKEKEAQTKKETTDQKPEAPKKEKEAQAKEEETAKEKEAQIKKETTNQKPVAPKKEKEASAEEEAIKQKEATSKEKKAPTTKGVTDKNLVAPKKEKETSAKEEATKQKEATSKEKEAPTTKGVTDKSLVAPKKEKETSAKEEATKQKEATSKEKEAPTTKGVTDKSLVAPKKEKEAPAKEEASEQKEASAKEKKAPPQKEAPEKKENENKMFFPPHLNTSVSEDFYGSVYAQQENPFLTKGCPNSIRNKVNSTDFGKIFLGKIPILQWAPHATPEEYKRLRHYGGCFGWNVTSWHLLKSTMDLLNSSANGYMFSDWNRDSKLRSSCIRCAAVGNGGILNGSKMGQEIDQHDYVFRVNGAILKGHEDDVGNRTSFYFFSTNTMMNSLYMYETDGFKAPPQTKDLSNTFVPDQDRDYHFVKAVIRRSPVDEGDDINTLPSKYFGENYTKEQFKMLHPDFMRYLRNRFLRSTRMEAGFSDIYRPSTGASMLLAALHACDEVDAYGFLTRDYKNYSDHYYDKVKKEVEFFANHDYAIEMALWQKLHEQGLIKLYTRS